jgi:hypothetical protein
MSDVKIDVMIVPFRRQYYDIVGAKQHYLQGLIYTVPDPGEWQRNIGRCL